MSKAVFRIGILVKLIRPIFANKKGERMRQDIMFKPSDDLTFRIASTRIDAWNGNVTYDLEVLFDGRLYVGPGCPNNYFKPINLVKLRIKDFLNMAVVE